MDSKTARLQRQLLLLQHAYRNCKYNYKDYECPLSLQCMLTKEAVSHMKSCKSGSSCATIYCCLHEAIAHWKQCICFDCCICLTLKTFTMAEKNGLSMLNALKLSFGILGFKIIEDRDHSGLDVLEKAINNLKCKMLKNHETENKWIIMQHIFDALKWEITSNQADMFTLLQSDIASKHVKIDMDFTWSPYVNTDQLELSEDERIKYLFKTFKFKINNNQADVNGPSEVDILKQIFICYKCKVANTEVNQTHSFKTEIIKQFFDALMFTTVYDKSDGDIMNQILDDFGCKVIINMDQLSEFELEELYSGNLTHFQFRNMFCGMLITEIEVNQTKECILQLACEIINDYIRDEGVESKILKPVNMKMIVNVLGKCTVIKENAEMLEEDIIKQVFDSFKFRITNVQIDECKLSNAKIFKRVLNALVYQIMRNYYPKRVLNSHIVKQILDDFGCRIEREENNKDQLYKCRVPEACFVKQVLDDLKCRIVRDESNETENLPAIDESLSIQQGIIQFDPLDLLAFEIDQAQAESSAQGITLSDVMDVSLLFVEKFKKWHREVSCDFRNKTLDRLLNVFFPDPSFNGFFNQKISKTKFILYAREVEKEIYEISNSVMEYHDLLAMKFAQYEF